MFILQSMSLTASCMSYGTIKVKYDDIIEEMLIPEQEMLIKLSVLDHLSCFIMKQWIYWNKNVVLAHQYDCINVFEIWYFHVLPKRKRKMSKANTWSYEIQALNGHLQGRFHLCVRVYKRYVWILYAYFVLLNQTKRRR